jgi:long-chain fatty acid transport protein
MSHPQRRVVPRPTIPCLALTILASLLLPPSGEALASGFSTARMGGEHGNPTTSNATAIYYNPAGIAESEGFHIFLDGNLALRSASYTHVEAASDIPEPTNAVGANNGDASLFNVAAAPMLGATLKVGDLAFGLGAYVPFGGSAIWDKNEAFEGVTNPPGPVDGVQRWFTIEGTLRSFYITATAAYRIEPIRLSIGVSGNLILSSIDTLRARTAEGDNNVAGEGRAYLDVSGMSASFAVGAMFEAVPKKLWIGASYQARPNVSGGMTLEGKLLTTQSGEQEVKVTQDLPDIYRLGIRYAVKKDLELRLFGDFSRWSSFKNQCVASIDNECEVGDDGSADTTLVTQNIERRWDDAFGVRVGMSFWPEPWAEVFSGIGYDSNAVPDKTLEPGLTDFDDVAVAMGARLKVVEQLQVALSYTHIFYATRDNTGKSGHADYPLPSRSPDAGGIYSQTIGVVNANVDVSF